MFVRSSLLFVCLTVSRFRSRHMCLFVLSIYSSCLFICSVPLLFLSYVNLLMSSSAPTLLCSPVVWLSIPSLCSSVYLFRLSIYSVYLSIPSIYLFPPSVPLLVYPSISSLYPSALLVCLFRPSVHLVHCLQNGSVIIRKPCVLA